MIIEEIDTLVVDSHRANWIFCRVRTKDGLEGYGEASLEFQEQAVVAAIDDMAVHLIGRNVHEVRRLHFEMERNVYWRFGPIQRSAWSGIELALWDLLGKEQNLPVHRLLGGAIHSQLPLYANAWFVGCATPDEFAEAARQATSQGFSKLKWDPFGQAHKTLSQRHLNHSMEIVRAVREAVGSDVDLLIEGHGRFNLHGALRTGQRLEEFGITWFEEPLEPGSPAQLGALRQRLRVPVAAGERCYSRFDVQSLLTAGAVDVIQPDICHVGGLQEMMRINALADSFQIAISPHNPNGPICHAATIQFGAMCENLFAVETMINDVSWRGEIADEEYVFADGNVHVPSRPGWGVDINWEAGKNFPFTRGVLRHYEGQVTDIHPPESGRWF